MNIVADVPHEILVNLSRLVDHPPFLSEYVDGDHRQNRQHDHQPATLGRHLDE